MAPFSSLFYCLGPLFIWFDPTGFPILFIFSKKELFDTLSCFIRFYLTNFHSDHNYFFHVLILGSVSYFSSALTCDNECPVWNQISPILKGFACVWVHSHRSWGGQRGSFWSGSPLPLFCASQGLNSGSRLMDQVPFPGKLSPEPLQFCNIGIYAITFPLRTFSFIP